MSSVNFDVSEEVNSDAICSNLSRSAGAIKRIRFTNIDGETVSRRVGDWVQFYPSGCVKDEQVGKIITIRLEPRPDRYVLVMENATGFVGSLDGHETVETAPWLCR